MAIIVTTQVTCSLLRYYRALLTKPKYKITPQRAKKKYLNFWTYVTSGIRADAEKGHPCMYIYMGQRFNRKGQPRYPSLKMIEYYDEARTKWYIAYVIDEETNDIVVTMVKQASVVKCGKQKDGTILLSEQKLCKIIAESIRRILYN